jgi:cyanophycin synthetase
VIYFCRDERHPVVTSAREHGGRVVFDRDGQVILAQGGHETPLMALNRIPLTHHGRVGFQVENVLAAVAAAWSLGVSLDVIRTGLATFHSSTHQVPGRFNIVEANGATIIIDYGHNPSAVAALIEAIEMFPNPRRSIIFSAEGDRRDEDILRQMNMLGESFDAISLYEYANLRGRQRGEIMALLRQGLVSAPRATEITEHPGEPEAVDLALKALQAGDLLVIQPKEIDDVIRTVFRYVAETADRPEPEPVIVHAGQKHALVGQAGV